MNYNDHTIRYSLHSDTYAWGYYGRGPQILAVAILGVYGNLHDTEDRATDSMLAATTHGMPPKPKDAVCLGVPFVRDNYKAFASEVIAKLPDKWTLTKDDIDEWVKSRRKAA